jgi:hypothetical protein
VAASVYQVTAPTTGSTAAKICDMPPGTTAILSTTSTSADVFLGLAATVTSSNGAPLDPSGPTVIANPAGASPFTLYGVAGTGTHVVGVILVTGR